MEEKNNIQISRAFGTITIALLVWIWLIPGLRSLIKGFNSGTTYLILALGLVVPLVAFLGNLPERLEQKKIDRPRVLAATSMFIAIGGLYLYNFAKSVQSTASDASFEQIHSLGVLLLLGLAIWQLFKALRAPVSVEEL